MKRWLVNSTMKYSISTVNDTGHFIVVVIIIVSYWVDIPQVDYWFGSTTSLDLSLFGHWFHNGTETKLFSATSGPRHDMKKTVILVTGNPIIV